MSNLRPNATYNVISMHCNTRDGFGCSELMHEIGTGMEMEMGMGKVFIRNTFRNAPKTHVT